jgi:heat shock protein HtpX
VYIIPEQTPNAFATGRNPENAAVAVTQGIMRLLSREELEGVIAHELAHIKHRDILIGSVAATIAGAINMLYYIGFFFGGSSDDEGGGGNILMILLAPIAAILIQMAISRSREYAADRRGAEIAGNPNYLASALENLERGAEALPMQNVNTASAHMFIVNPLRGGGLRSLFSTHPPTKERVRRLREMMR